MDAIDRVTIFILSMWLVAGVVLGGLAHRMKPPEAHSGPQCTEVYPRGFEFSEPSREDGRGCGDIAAGWRNCVPRWSI